MKSLCGDLEHASQDFSEAVTLGERLGIRHRADESRFKAASVLATLGRLEESSATLRCSPNAENQNPKGIRTAGYTLQLMLQAKIEAARGRSFSFGNLEEPILPPRLDAIVKEMLGDCHRLCLRLDVARQHYHGALEIYQNVGAVERVWAVSAKISQISPSFSMSLVKHPHGRIPRPEEIFWLVI